MELLDLTAVLICLIAALAFLNARVLRLPSTVGVTLGGLLVSVVLLGLAAFDVPLALDAVQAVRAIDFDEVVFQGVLSFLLFAGALGVDTHMLWRMRGPVLAFALLATALSIALVGVLVQLLFSVAGLSVSFTYCLLFGALISPTDPVAVLGMLRQARVPQGIETLVAGESLFNDGVGVVAFAVLAGLLSGPGQSVGRPAAEAVGQLAGGATGGHGTSPGEIAVFFVQEAFGGLALGLVLGYLAYLALRAVDDFVTEMLVTLGLVLALTAVADRLHLSAPLAAVAAGLLVGLLTDRRPAALSSRHRFEGFWHLLDELLNVALFALLALELVAVELDRADLLLGVAALPLVLLARTASVNVPYYLLHHREHFPPYTRRLMVWGGLRGAISVALAFGVPSGDERDSFLVMTYVIVVFSIVAQGLTVRPLARWAARAAAVEEASSPSRAG
jgi:CPA1 family monovalent cation:H+ antiporter